MTHIPCTVRRFADGYLPFVTFSILQPPLYVTIDALVDTGSPFTVLSPKDALSTRLPLSRMRSGPTIGLAGCTFSVTTSER
jgi:predicted aspartyl protease